MNPTKQNETEMYQEVLGNLREIDQQFLDAKIKYKHEEDRANKKRVEAFAAADKALRDGQRALILEYRKACELADKEFDDDPERLAALNDVNDKHIIFRTAWNAFRKIDGGENEY